MLDVVKKVVEFAELHQPALMKGKVRYLTLSTVNSAYSTAAYSIYLLIIHGSFVV